MHYYHYVINISDVYPFGRYNPYTTHSIIKERLWITLLVLFMTL